MPMATFGVSLHCLTVQQLLKIRSAIAKEHAQVVEYSHFHSTKALTLRVLPLLLYYRAEIQCCHPTDFHPMLLLP